MRAICLKLVVVFVALQSSYLQGKAAGAQFKTGEPWFDTFSTCPRHVYRRHIRLKVPFLYKSENDWTFFISFWNMFNEIARWLNYCCKLWMINSTQPLSLPDLRWTPRPPPPPNTPPQTPTPAWESKFKFLRLHAVFGENWQELYVDPWRVGALSSGKF